MIDTITNTINIARIHNIEVDANPARSSEAFGSDLRHGCASMADAIEAYLRHAKINPADEARLKSVEWILFTARLATYLDRDGIINALEQAIRDVKGFFAKVPAYPEPQEEEPVVVEAPRPTVSTNGFCVGDRVMCVDDRGLSTLEAYKVYIVKAIGGSSVLSESVHNPNFIQLEGLEGGFYDSRFILAKEESPVEPVPTNPFKVGDRVILIDGDPATEQRGMVEGLTYEVESINGSFVRLVGFNGGWFASRFKMAPEAAFKVGDLVVAVEDSPDNHITKGEVFTVTEFDMPDLIDIKSKEDGHSTVVFTRRLKKLPENYRAKPGDTLRCVDDAFAFGGIVKGDTYTLAGESPLTGAIYVDGSPYPWRSSRFEVVRVADVSAI